MLTVIDLSKALIIPVVTDCPSPSALPIATTCWPTVIVSESASSAIAILLSVSEDISDNDTATTAISWSDLEPLTVALTASSSTNTHFKLDTLSTTCALVTIRSSVSFFPTMIPVPLVEASYCCCPPQLNIDEELPVTDVVPLRATIAGSAAEATVSTFIEPAERLASPSALSWSVVAVILLATVDIL